MNFKLDYEDFKCLVRGGTLHLPDGHLMILQDIGFENMRAAIESAEQGIDIYKSHMQGRALYTKYRKKPIEIEAIKYTQDTFNQVYVWLEQECPNFVCDNRNDPVYFIIPTLEGDMKLMPGDYLIRGVKGEFYPCKADIFELSYDESTNE